MSTIPAVLDTVHLFVNTQGVSRNDSAPSRPVGPRVSRTSTGVANRQKSFDDIDIHAEYQITCCDPIRQRTSPHDRRSPDEQDVAGVDGARIGNVNDDVAARVGRADFDQFDGATGDVEIEATLERASRQFQFDSLEVE